MEETTASKTPFRFLAYSCALSPIVLLILYITLPFHAYHALGRWPRYSDLLGPESSIAWHTVAFNNCALITGFVAPSIWGLMHFWPVLRPTVKERRRQLAVFITTWTIFWVLFLLNFHGISGAIIDA